MYDEAGRTGWLLVLRGRDDIDIAAKVKQKARKQRNIISGERSRREPMASDRIVERVGENIGRKKNRGRMSLSVLAPSFN